LPIGTIINEEGAPVEVAPERGNLRHSSVPGYISSIRRGLSLVDRHLSFAQLYASQPLVGVVAGWFMRQHRRVPLKVYRREPDEGHQELRPGEHPLATAIHSPWERGSQIDFVASLLGSFLVHGNGINEIDSGARETLRFIQADWRFAAPIMPWRDTIAGWDLDVDNPELKRMRGADAVLHVRDWSPLGPFGVSPLQQLGVTISIEDAAQRHQRAMLANGVRTAAAVQATDDKFFGLQPEERKELMDGLREDVEDTQSGPENAGRPWVLPPGLEIKTVGQTAQEAALIEQRVVTRTEALGIYGLLPATAGVIERGVTALLREDDVFVAFDFSELLRGDRLKEIDAIRGAIATAVKTPNEGRTDLGLPRSNQKGMDDHYLPRNNLWPLSVPYPDKGMGASAAGENDAGGSSADDLARQGEPAHV
jgi:hypothetical protein